MKSDYVIKMEKEFGAFLKIADGLGIKYSEDMEYFYDVCRDLGFNGNGSLYYDVYDYIDNPNGIIKAIANNETIYLEFGHHTLRMTLRFALYCCSRFDVEILLDGDYRELSFGDEVFILSEVIGKLKDVMIEMTEQQFDDLKCVQKQVSDVYEEFENDFVDDDITSPIMVKWLVESRLEVGAEFRNYKHLFMHLGWQKREEQLSGAKREQFLLSLKPFVKIEKIQEGKDRIIIEDIFIEGKGKPKPIERLQGFGKRREVKHDEEIDKE